MITEARFAASHHSFWHELMPMAESYLRACNLDLGRFARPMHARSSPNERGLVNELGFRLFARAVATQLSPLHLPREVVEQEAELTRLFIQRFRQHGRGPLPPIDEEGRSEARDLAERTLTFFTRASLPDETFQVRPGFPGCGWLSACEGDVLWRSTLYEIKAGERSFRSTDLRQLLVYCALAFVSKTREISSICLMNPRHGVFFCEPLSDVCSALAGRSAAEVLSDIVEYLSISSDAYPFT